MVKAYVLTISPPGSARYEHASRTLDALGLDYQMVDSFTADDVGKNDFYNPYMNFIWSKYRLTKEEIATYAGHRKCWRTFLQSADDHALILEDDFKVLDQRLFFAAINDARQLPEKWSIIKLFDVKEKTQRSYEVKAGETTFMRQRIPCSGAVGYIITRKGAEALLKRKKFFRQVDTDISYPWEFGLDVWSVSPNPLDEIARELGGSLIEKGRNERRARKNILRSLKGNFIALHRHTRSILASDEIKGPDLL